MRKCFAFMIAVATLGLCAETASAKSFEIGFHTKGYVGKACDAAGGSFRNDGLIYQCVKEDCDGKGGSCSVTCNAETEKCFGSTPNRVTQPPGKYDLVKILKFSPALPPRGGLLEPGQGASPHGPSGPGTPKPAAPPAAKLY